MTLAFARFDLQSWFPRTQTLLTLGFIVVAGAVLPLPVLAIVAAAVVTSLMVSTPFLADERGRLDSLYGVLPVSRGAVVAGRTLALLAYGVVALAVAVATTVVAGMLRGTALPLETLLVAVAVAFAIIGLAMSLQLPVFFRIGYSRGRLMSMAPTLVLAGLVWLGGTLGLLSDATVWPPAPLAIAVSLAVGVVGVTVGTVIAYRLYRSRELR
jgi:hypothetical protein